jgi:3-hydroxybutyryl-CoA dehydrogenase
MDLVGLDVNLAVSRSVFEQTAHEPRFRPHLLQESLVRAGQLGRKSGRGFYDHAADPPRPTLPQRPLLAPPPGPWGEWDADAARGYPLGRLLACLVNEAYWAVGQGVATRADVDLAMRLGTNWPKGPFAWAAELGPELVWRSLVALRDAHGDAYLPAPLLRHEAD